MCTRSRGSEQREAEDGKGVRVSFPSRQAVQTGADEGRDGKVIPAQRGDKGLMGAENCLYMAVKVSI